MGDDSARTQSEEPESSEATDLSGETQSEEEGWGSEDLEKDVYETLWPDEDGSSLGTDEDPDIQVLAGERVPFVPSPPRVAAVNQAVKRRNRERNEDRLRAWANTGECRLARCTGRRQRGYLFCAEHLKKQPNPRLPRWLAEELGENR